MEVFDISIIPFGIKTNNLHIFLTRFCFYTEQLP